MPLRPTFADGGRAPPSRSAASYAACTSIPGTPLRYASANATSELVPTIRSAYPGEDQREIQPPSRYCCTNPSTSSPARLGVSSEYAGHAVRYVSHSACAWSRTESKDESPSSISRLRRAWSTLSSEVAIRSVTPVSDGANRKYPPTLLPPPSDSFPLEATGRSTTPYTKSRPAPTDSPLRTSL